MLDAWAGAQRPGCRCGSRYVEWCWGLPYLKQFIGFVVSWFLVFCFLVYWLLGFLVSWFQSFLVSWLQRFKKSFKVFERYLAHITKFPFHVSRKILILYARFPRISQTDLHHVSVSAFSKIVETLYFQIVGFYLKNKYAMIFRIFFRYPGVSKDI